MESEQFSGAPLSQDEIRLENEILKLRLQAEFGSVFPDPAMSSADPEPEYAFLKRVLQLHQRIAGTPPRPLKEVLDFGRFAPAESFSDEASLREAFLIAIGYLEDANVIVDFDNDYPIRVMYEFITLELPELEVIGNPGNDEYICVLYEAFHPNLPAEAEDAARDFLESLLLGDLLLYPETYFRTRWLPARLGNNPEEQLRALLEQFYSCFDQITHWTILPDSTRLLEAAQTPSGCDGMASVRGDLSYWVTLSDGSVQEIETPFGVDLRRDCGLWFITDFEFRGFIWTLGGT